MDKYEKMKKHNPKFAKLLSEYAENSHVPFELIYANAEGKLSEERHRKIVSHIDSCEECNEIHRLIKELISEEEDSTDVIANVRLDPKLISKIKLVSSVNSQRDDVAEKIAQLFLPEEMWFSIKPSIIVYRNWLNSSITIEPAESEELPIAAFSGGDTEDMEEFEIVIDSVQFSDFICDLLAERCGSLDEIKDKLPDFIDDGMAIFEKVKVDEGSERKIFVAIKDVFEES